MSEVPKGEPPHHRGCGFCQGEPAEPGGLEGRRVDPPPADASGHVARDRHGVVPALPPTSFAREQLTGFSKGPNQRRWVNGFASLASRANGEPPLFRVANEKADDGSVGRCARDPD